MLSVGWLIAAVLVAVLLTSWVTFTVTRLDRLHARVDAAQAALDAQLVRRSTALRRAAEPLPDRQRFDQVATVALNAADPDREAAENEVGRVITELAVVPEQVGPDEAVELHEACVRVAIARRFYNDAVRDTRVLRGRRMPRILHLAGHRELPQFFDIDDTPNLPEPRGTSADGGEPPSASTQEAIS